MLEGSRHVDEPHSISTWAVVAEVTEQFGTEALCEAELERLRWPEGFRCPKCDHPQAYILHVGAHKTFQCQACRTQTSLIAGTLFQSTHLALTVWFLAIYLVSQAKTGAECTHHVIVVGTRKPKDLPAFSWVNTLWGNLKSSFGGAYHACDFEKYRARYLGIFAYRFNRRFRLETIHSRLLLAAATTGPRPARWLSLAEEAC